MPKYISVPEWVPTSHPPDVVALKASQQDVMAMNVIIYELFAEVERSPGSERCEEIIESVQKAMVSHWNSPV